MKITIPTHLKGKELFAFLLANKEALIAEKKSMPVKFSDPVCSVADVKFIPAKAGAKKDDSGNTEDPIDSDKLHVKVVANTFLYMDSQYDVLIPGCCKRTLNNSKSKLRFLHDHIYKIDAKVGEVTDAYTQDMMLSDLGLSQIGSTECLIFEADIYKSYNQQIFNQYKANKIDQHSIGLQYVKIDIAINDPDSPKEIEFWNKYINQIINKDEAIAAGFFFVVSEIKLLENSCVLFGANPITPTLETGKSAKKDAGVNTDAGNSDAITFIDQMTRRHKKSIKYIDEFQQKQEGEDDPNPDDDDNYEELMKSCDSMKSMHQDHIDQLGNIKDKMLSGKSHSAPDTQKTDPSKVATESSLKAIREFNFLSN